MGDYLSKNFKTHAFRALIGLSVAAGLILFFRPGPGDPIALLAVLAAFWVVYQSTRNALKWFSGAYGEDEVYDVLANQLGGHVIIRNLQTGEGDIDILVVGPTGVHVIEVKNFRHAAKARGGSVTYGGHDVSGQLKRNVDFLKRKLEWEGLRVPLEGHLLMLGDVKGEAQSVVRKPTDLVRRIKQGPRVSREEELDLQEVFGKFSG